MAATTSELAIQNFGYLETNALRDQFNEYWGFKRDSVRRSFKACCWDTQGRSPCVVKDQITKLVYNLTQTQPTIKELKRRYFSAFVCL